jgi:phosphoglycolate phosphatase
VSSGARKSSHRSALLFDLDGCLVDSLPSIVRCWAEALSEFGYRPPTPVEIRPHLGPPADVAARHFAPGASEQMIEAIITSYRARSEAATEARAYAGVPELVERLSARRVLLAVATSKSVEVAAGLLERLHLARWFSLVEGTPAHELGTDKTTVVARLLDRLAPIRPEALVGDRSQDVRAAHAHGLLAIGALWGYGSREELIAAGADRLAETPADVLGLVTV